MDCLSKSACDIYVHMKIGRVPFFAVLILCLLGVSCSKGASDISKSPAQNESIQAEKDISLSEKENLSTDADKKDVLETANQEYIFSISNNAYSPIEYYSGRNDHGKPQEGDFIKISDISLRLGEPGEYKYKVDVAGSGRIYRTMRNGKRIVAGVLIDEKNKIKPIAKMTAEEIANLTGVYIKAFEKGFTEKQISALKSFLAQIDVERTFISIDVGYGLDIISYIPENTKYLRVEQNYSSSDKVYDYSVLSRFKSLRYFDFNAFEPLHVDYIVKNKELHSLITGEVVNEKELASFKEMTVLTVLNGMENVDFVRQLPKLTYFFTFSRTLTDISAFDNHPSVKWIDVRSSPVEKIPTTRIPSLIYLNLFSSIFAKNNAQQDKLGLLKQKNPQCRVVYSWVDSFKEAVKGSTRLELEDSGEFDVIHKSKETNQNATDDLIDHMIINPEKSGYSCACDEGVLISFFKEKELLASFLLKHGRNLAVAGKGPDWPGDALLNKESAIVVDKWMVKHRFSSKMKEILEDESD